MRGFLATGVLLALAAPAAALELKNDSFVSGNAAAQAGFCQNEAAASRFVAPDAGRQLLRIHFVYSTGGGPDVTRTVTIKVWDDTAGTNAPGAELYSNDYQVTSSSTDIQQVDLTAENVVVPAQFRVGIVFQNAGVPSIANDIDGVDYPDRNYIWAINGTTCGPAASLWIRSSTAGVSGDWILRAEVSGSGGGPDANPGGPDGGTSGGPCSSNPDCPEGQYCDVAAGACTFDCRTDDDCGDQSCNSLGQCVEGGGGGGCGCQAETPAQAGILLAFAALFLIVRRRR